MVKWVPCLNIFITLTEFHYFAKKKSNGTKQRKENKEFLDIKMAMDKLSLGMKKELLERTEILNKIKPGILI